MTLGQEIGAVMMVGFSGPLTPAMLADWRQRQFGGVILLPAEQQAADPGVIESLRGVMAHPLLAATDETGGDMTAVAERLKAQGFDVDLEPDVDLASGQSAAAATRQVAAVVAALHAAGIYSAVSVSARTPQAQVLSTLRAAIGARVDVVMVRNLNVPLLRRQLGFQGVVISADLPSPLADEVGFLESGGDMVVISHDIVSADAVYDAIHLAVLSGRYRRSQLDASVQKLLNLGLRFMP
jgi:beta-glucosidase-like glycosyl hydrolase